ncbi:NAD(P)H-dependent oxidoreductase subunit E [Desulfobulbus rhabdoformis]|uniref:NADH-quinone oxidoreductase subunit NuoE family protein n=1 Tax=Desulfobulbus rhabdoformis TaxID=34032 RepID=UPI001962AB6C|nr:NAD(P)H-dependent oxidoreductase subunit E [Desulfobulbus rhabdoformis]MBM9616597.1 NAD(P)H-dependent oxidoreductase subunit E [Desulfobulbus rhabdoformis]
MIEQGAAVQTPARRFDKVCTILDENGRQPQRLIPILQAVQEEYRYLPEDVLTFVADGLGIPGARVYGVATFYSHFTLEPKGKYIVRLCDGTACHVKRSIPILEALHARLGLSSKQSTTDDMLFTVETVACLGACGLAPVVMINEEVHGQMTPAAAIELIDAIVAREKLA